MSWMGEAIDAGQYPVVSTCTSKSSLIFLSPSSDCRWDANWDCDSLDMVRSLTMPSSFEVNWFPHCVLSISSIRSSASSDADLRCNRRRASCFR